jgi:glycosyltransferase involved in cell wall biosynthesis
MRVLSGENIICLAHEPWHGPWKTYQQIMSVLAESNRVLYVGPPRPLREEFGKLLKRTKRPAILERITDTLHVYNEPRLLGSANVRRPFGRLFNRIAGRLRLAQVRRLAHRLGMTAPILWLFDPMMIQAVGALGEKLVIAYILDNYVEFFPPNDVPLRAAMARNEERLLTGADVVFAVSDSLYRHCLTYNHNSFLVPNGVNHELFQAVAAKGAMPADLAGIRRPIIGFVGAIQGDIDFSLLNTLCAARPEWSLVLVGPNELGGAHSEHQALLRRPNVHYLGCKPVQDVPSYIHACDVCIMPQSVDKSTVPDSDNIKLYEYLACGKPIVSTDIPSARRFRPLVEIAGDASEFEHCVARCLGEEPSRSQMRIATARDHSWQRRVEAISDAITRTRDRVGGAAMAGGVAVTERDRPPLGSRLDLRDPD